MSIYDVPDIEVIETDADIILSNIKSKFESVVGRTLYPGDPLLIIIKAFASAISQIGEKITDVENQNFVKFAKDGYLENLGALVGVNRLQPTSSLTTLKFTISQAQNSIISIAQGTRVMTGNNVYFATTENAQIEIGTTEITVIAKCTETGIMGNDFEVGQINQIVDLYPFYQSVENITISKGGSDIETLESLRVRIFEAPDSYSTAGPTGAYKFWAKSVNSLITDVSVSSPENSPGVVEIIPLLSNGEIPSNELLQQIYEVCSADDKRPLTDNVIVNAPIVKEYEVNIKYFISRKDANLIENISLKVNAAVDEYIAQQRDTLGKDINPSKLIEFLMQTGIKRVEVISPIFTVLGYNEVAFCQNEPTISLGGLENV